MTRRELRRSPVLAQLRPPAMPSQQAILQEIRRAVVEGAVPPGSPLPLDAMAELFGVSRIPVREALKTLQGEGLVDHEPRHGYTVAQLSRDELVELYTVRSALEAAVLARAAMAATPQDHERAREVHRHQGELLRSGDAAGWDRGSRAFHIALLGPAGSRRVQDMVEATWNITEPAQPMRLLSPEQLAVLHDEHEAMLTAFVERDTERLLRWAEVHARQLRTALDSIPADHRVFADRGTADISAPQRGGNTEDEVGETRPS